MDLDALNDDQALALLLKNETVAGLLQNSFVARVEEHQQKLDQAYNQRLLELEEYTRIWRDTIKELWSAIDEGKFKLDTDQRDTLLWKGPQDAGHGFHPELPTAPQEIVEKESDADGRVACISIKASRPPQSPPKVACHEWVTDTESRGLKFSPLSWEFRSVAGVHSNERLLFRTTDKCGHAEYRPYRAIQNIMTEFSNRHDVFIELSPENVRILGKAFCYLNDRKNRCLPEPVPTTDIVNRLGNAKHLYNYFSAKPTPTHIHVLVLPKKKKKRQTALLKELSQQTQAPRRLLIARPRVNKHGETYDASFLDVGSDMLTTRRSNGEYAFETFHSFDIFQ